VTDRTAKLEAAVRAQDELIASAQGLLTRYLVKEIESPALVERLLWLFTGRSNARRSGSRVKRWARISATTLRVSRPIGQEPATVPSAVNRAARRNSKAGTEFLARVARRRQVFEYDKGGLRSEASWRSMVGDAGWTARHELRFPGSRL
jgi:hypothetical protein